MKKFLSLVVLTAAVTASVTATAETALSINYTDGTVTSIALSAISTVTVDDGTVIVTKTDATQNTADTSDITNITFGEWAGITAINTDDDSYSGAVEVYAIDGRLVLTTTVNNGETVNLDCLDNGVYIIRAGNKATKVRK